MNGAQVTCHSGYRGDEYPLSFSYEGKEYDAEKVVLESLEENLETGERRRVFLVKTRDGLEFRLTRWEGRELWEVAFLPAGRQG